MIPTEQATAPLTDFQQYELEVKDGAEPQVAGKEPAKTEVAEPSGDGQKPSEKAAPESETGESTAEKEEKKDSKRGQSKRIDELTREKYEAREEAARLRKELDAFKAKQSEPSTPAAAASADEAPKEPDFNAFATFAEYQVAFQKWTKDLLAHQLKLARRQDAEDAKAAERLKVEREAAETWDSRVELARADHDDYDTVAFDSKLPVSPVMFALLRESEHGADVLYHLGKNHGDAERIAALKPAGQAIALARLEAKLFPETAAPATKAAAVSKAPKPPVTITGEGGEAADAEPDPADYQKWERWANRRDARKRRDEGRDD